MLKVNLINLLSNISVWIIFLPLLLGVVFLRKLSKDSRLILILVFFAAIPQSLHGFRRSSDYLDMVYNIYTIIEFLLFAIFFANKFKNRRRVCFFRITLIIYAIFGCLLVWFFGIRNRFLHEWVCLNNLCFTFWILLFVFEQYHSDEINFTFSNSLTWYLTVQLLYSPCTILVFSTWTYRFDGKYILDDVKVIHSIFNILLYLGFSIGFCLDSFSFFRNSYGRKSI